MTSVDPIIKKLIEKKFEKQEEFIPGKSIISLIKPSFGSDENYQELLLLRFF